MNAKKLQSLRRIEGFPPHALQRALELQAAFEVIRHGLRADQEEKYRGYLVSGGRRWLHGFVGRHLALYPHRRYTP